MDSNTLSVLQELENVLHKFKLQHFEPYVIPEFPETSWTKVGHFIKSKKLLWKSRTITQFLIFVVKQCGVEEDKLTDRIDVLKILAVVVNNKKDWNTFELSAPNNELRLVTPTTLAPRIGRSLSARMQSKRLIPEVHSVKYTDSYWFSVVFRKLSTHKSTAPIYFVIKPGGTVLFASTKPGPIIMETICKSIGYDAYKDMKLKGQHLPSLYRILDQRNNMPISQFNGLPEYSPVPELSTTGIDFTHSTYNEKYVNDILGDDPPLLNSLEVNAVEPFYDTELEKMADVPMNMRVRITSKNTAETLKEMVRRNIIKPDSIWLNFFQRTRRNQINLKVERR